MEISETEEPNTEQAAQRHQAAISTSANGHINPNSQVVQG